VQTGDVSAGRLAPHTEVAQQDVRRQGPRDGRLVDAISDTIRWIPPLATSESEVDHAADVVSGAVRGRACAELSGLRRSSRQNVWPGRIRRRVFQGDFTQYHVDWDGRQLIVRTAASEPMAEGDEVLVSADARHCVLLEE
jgi:hypothetical protein